MIEDDYDDEYEEDFDDDDDDELDLDEDEDFDDDDGYVMRGDPPSSGLLSFYDRLRERVLATVERKGGKLGTGMVQVLLVAPDLFMLLARLALDPNVPGKSRSLVGGALAYFVIPVDLLPEALLGVGGYTDDVVLAATVLSHVFSNDLAPYVQRHWSGSRELSAVLQSITQTSWTSPEWAGRCWARTSTTGSRRFSPAGVWMSMRRRVLIPISIRMSRTTRPRGPARSNRT